MWTQLDPDSNASHFIFLPRRPPPPSQLKALVAPALEAAPPAQHVTL